MTESTAEYRAELDHFAEFISDRLVCDGVGRISRKGLREEYRIWADETGRRALLGAHEIAKRLRQRGYQEIRLKGDRVWVGLRIRRHDDADEGMGADLPDVGKMSSGLSSQGGLSRKDAPICTRSAAGDDLEERTAIREEGSTQATPPGLPLRSMPDGRGFDG